jgi:hypothetical protein
MQDNDELVELHRIAFQRAIADDLRGKRSYHIERFLSISKNNQTAFKILSRIENLSEKIERTGQ